MSVVGDRVVEGSQNGLRDGDLGATQARNPPEYPLLCYWCGSRDNLRRCGRCHSAFYCSNEHQRSHWETHRKECRERVRPEELQPSNDRESEFPTPPNSEPNFEYSQKTVTTEVPKSKESGQMTSQSEIDSLLCANVYDPSQLGAITELLPSALEDNFNNIDLSMLLDDSNSTAWSKMQAEVFREVSLVDGSNVGMQCQAGQPTPESQETAGVQYSPITPPPPYEYNLFGSSGLDSLNISSNNQDNSNLLTESIAPGGSNRLPQQFLYELTDLTSTDRASRDKLPLSSVPLPESPATAEFLNRVCSNVVNDMNQFGICVIDNFLGRRTGEAILSEVKEMYSDGMFKEGQLVTSSRRTISQTIRGDRITWVDGTEESCRFIGLLIHTLDSIVSRCQKMKNCGLFGRSKINRRTKAMIACYPGNGTHYVKHVDNPNQDGRCITSIYYLNQAWDVQLHGGLLRMFPAGCNNQVANIEPLFDRILFFWSDRRNPHQVLPAFSVRFAITVWYCDAEERNKAVFRFEEEMQQRKKDAQGLEQISLHPQ